MGEQSGTGRYPKPPASEAWGGSEFNSNDPDQGNFGSPFAEAAGKESSAKAGSSNGNAKSVPSPVAGSNFTGGPSGEGEFEQGEIPSTEINYFGFKG
jgi:hypothetical protein